VPANEQGAGFMAAGYARSTGKVGCVPGDLRARRHQLRDADPRLHGRLHPVVLICGQVPRAAMGTRRLPGGAGLQHHEPCAKHVFLVLDPEKLEATVRTRSKSRAAVARGRS
jgi:acetolactate synthase-1/2/3 large subunit